MVALRRVGERVGGCDLGESWLVIGHQPSNNLNEPLHLTREPGGRLWIASNKWTVVPVLFWKSSH